MICLICETPILERDSFYWQFDIEYNDESAGGVHDDCLLREIEFRGDIKQAKQIYVESRKSYRNIKPLPKG